VTPAEVKDLVPYVDESILLGGFYSPSVAVVDSLRFGTLMREKAQAKGAQVFATTEVLGIDVEGGRVKRVRTSRGDIEAEIVVIACGVWSPRIARMAGASIPLTPAVHQMIDVGPVPRFLTSKTAVDFPIVRDMDTNMYERQDGQGLEVGSYAHRPILHDPDEIPSIEEASLTPTELPFTQEDFEQQLEHALELVPEVLGDESVGIKYAINGLLSLTPDGLPLLGETPEVKGLWSAAAVWVKEGPGVGRAMAEWIVQGQPEIDLQSSDIARFYSEQRTPENINGRASEGFNKTYGIVHPGEQWATNRDVRRTDNGFRLDLYERFLVDLGELRGPLQARAETEQRSRNELVREAVARYLTPSPAEPCPDPHQVQVTLDDALRAWVDSWRDGEEDVAAVILRLLTLLNLLYEDGMPNMVLVDLPEPLQEAIATRLASLQRTQPEQRWSRARLIRSRLKASFPPVTPA